MIANVLSVIALIFGAIGTFLGLFEASAARIGRLSGLPDVV